MDAHANVRGCWGSSPREVQIRSLFFCLRQWKGQKQIPFENEHCMQRRRFRAVTAPDGRGLGVAEDAGEQQIPFGNDNQKGKNKSNNEGSGVADG